MLSFQPFYLFKLGKKYYFFCARIDRIFKRNFTRGRFTSNYTRNRRGKRVVRGARKEEKSPRGRLPIYPFLVRLVSLLRLSSLPDCLPSPAYRVPARPDKFRSLNLKCLATSARDRSETLSARNGRPIEGTFPPRLSRFPSRETRPSENLPFRDLENSFYFHLEIVYQFSY